jgi:hypothetical protein
MSHSIYDCTTAHMKSSHADLLYSFVLLVPIRSELTKSESYVMTDGQSASLSWYKAPICAYDQIFISVRNTEYVGELRVC